MRTERAWLRCVLPVVLATCASFAPAGQNVVVVLDDSGSMNERMRSNRRVTKMDAAKEAGMYETALTVDADKELYEKLEAAGVKFTGLNNSEIAEKIRPVYDSWTKVFGADLLEKVDEFKADYNKNN